VKVSRTVLKTSRRGDSTAEFNYKIRHLTDLIDSSALKSQGSKIHDFLNLTTPLPSLGQFTRLERPNHCTADRELSPSRHDYPALFLPLLSNKKACHPTGFKQYIE
jgi:hypothetical protein